MRFINAWIAVGALVSGCAGQAARPPANEVTRIPEDGDWFCQQSRDRQGWECVQDPELAENPRPERLPEGPQAAPPGVPGAPAAPSPPGTPAGPSQPGPEPTPGPAPRPGPVEAPSPPDPPAEQPPLGALPPDHHAVQLLAMFDRDEVADFARRHRLDGARIVPVERSGRLYHVLLLDVYPTLDEARRAVARLPDALGDMEPWIRPVRSLQRAVARAEAMTDPVAGAPAP